MVEMMLEFLAPHTRAKGSPVLRVDAELDGQPFGQLWTFTTEADDGRKPSYWFYRSRDGKLYGYCPGQFGYADAMTKLERYAEKEGLKCLSPKKP